MSTVSVHASAVQQQPGTRDTLTYRQALSCFATGVTVVTSHWQDADWGMTCNSFASVSLEPPLVLWSIRKAARSLEAFTLAEGFMVSVLSDQQEAVARQFTAPDMASRFANVALERESGQRLRLRDALAWFDCTTQQVLDAGDHMIVIGEVQRYGSQDGSALSFWRSRFGRIEALAT